MPAGTRWTDDETAIAHLATRWPQTSATIIAEEISALTGARVTRNSIIGKAHRMKLPSKGGVWTKEGGPPHI